MNIVELLNMLRTARIKKGLSMSKLEELSGVSSSHICRVENKVTLDVGLRTVMKLLHHTDYELVIRRKEDEA